MALLSGNDTYWKIATHCARCQKCTHVCPSLTMAGMTMGTLAQTMLEHQATAGDADDLMASIMCDAELTQAVRGCFLCTNCQAACLADNDISELIYACRKDFQDLGLIPRSAWSSVQVDQEWDIFTAYRAIHGIGYGDLTRHLGTADGVPASDCAVAFFPGCSLAAYAPELTREVFATIEQLGRKTTMIDHCCGSPLRSAGFFERAIALTERIVSEIVQSGAKQVVCVCPGCRNAVESALAAQGVTGVQAVNLAHFLREHAFVPKRDIRGVNWCLSRSCQDRTGEYLEDISALLGMPGGHPHTVFTGCCGAGGAVSAFNPNLQSSQIAGKLAQVPDGTTIVTACPTCTYTYALELLSRPRPIENKNYLELLFENGFDWDLVYAQLNGMWTGEYGPWLAQVFA